MGTPAHGTGRCRRCGWSMDHLDVERLLSAWREQDPEFQRALAADAAPGSLLAWIQSIEAAYQRTKAKRQSGRIPVWRRCRDVAAIVGTFRGRSRRMLLHHYLYVWYITAFWHS